MKKEKYKQQYKETVKLKGLFVEVSPSKDKKSHELAVSFALAELKKDIKKEGLMQELKEREYYMSPSRTRRHKTNEAIKQRKRDAHKVRWNNKNKISY